MKKSAKFWAAILAIAAIGAAVYSLASAKPVSLKGTKIVRRDARVVLAVTGKIEPVFESIVSSPASPSRISQVNVDLGDRVRAGQVLVRLDTSTLESQRDQAVASQRIAENNVIKAKLSFSGARESSSLAQQSLENPTDPRASRDQAAGNVRVETQRVKQAEATLQKLQKGGRSEEVAKAETSVVSAETRLSERTRNLARTRFLYEEKAVSRSEVEQAEDDVTTARQDLEAAKSNVLQLATSRSEDIQEAIAGLGAAKASLASAVRHLANLEESLKTRYSLRSQLSTATSTEDARRLEIQAAEAEYQRALAAVRQIEEQLLQSEIVAPIDGVVSRRSAQVGETAQTGRELFRITTSQQFRAVVDIDEKYVWQIRPGQMAEFQPEAFPALRFNGTVEEVAREADPSRGTVKVRLRIDGTPDPRLRADLSLDINIVTDELKDALVVPNSAVMRDGEMAAVVTVVDGVARIKKVELDRQTDVGTVVKKGLAGGETILVEPRLASEGQRIRVIAP